MGSAYERLAEERRRLQERLSRIEEMLQKYDALEQEAKALFSVNVTEEPDEVRATAKVGSVQPVAQQPSPMEVYARELRAIMEGALRPMPRADVLDALRDRGVVVGGANELNTLGTRLHRTPWIVNLKGHGYWLRERDYEPAGHKAGSLDLGPFKLVPTQNDEDAHPMFPGHKLVPHDPQDEEAEEVRRALE